MAEQLRIGICDDEECDRERIAALLRAILPDFLPALASFAILSFETGEKLLEGFSQQPFSLAFLDIEMPGEGGMELAVRLEAFSRDTDIVFVSNYQNYIFDTQEFEPLWFVRKEKLEKDLRRALQKYFRKNSYKLINYKIDDGFGKKNIPLDSIWYMEGSGHELRVAAGAGDYRIYGSLMKTGEELAPYGFIRTHRNYLVNSRYISHIIGNELELYGGIRLPLGRSYKKEVLERMRKNDWRNERLD